MVFRSARARQRVEMAGPTHSPFFCPVSPSVQAEPTATLTSAFARDGSSEPTMTLEVTHWIIQGHPGTYTLIPKPQG